MKLFTSAKYENRQLRRIHFRIFLKEARKTNRGAGIQYQRLLKTMYIVQHVRGIFENNTALFVHRKNMLGCDDFNNVSLS
jgi:hypothetical protein